ncbi:phospholipase A2, membrane associated-like [Protopterus annectens]|uniref:phospholipase A2, membrane associated-like n=1 Tax=Protopterus annectens TaxID=7888 RepID=UPI001CFA1B4F|nr:phospholipase A2, membrane associated-like [Protopterus annectens]
MKWLLLCLLTIGFTFPCADSNTMQFGSLVYYATRRNILQDYTGYGCYCGIGGKGQPVDATDRCCHALGCCYTKLRARGCNPKLKKYKVALRKGKINCMSMADPCMKSVCECDRSAALCFQAASKSYRKAYRYFPNVKCRGSTPRC